MIIDDTITDAKQQHNILTLSSDILTLSSGKFYICEYLLGEKIPPSNWRQIIKQAKFMNSPTEKTLGK